MAAVRAELGQNEGVIEIGCEHLGGLEKTMLLHSEGISQNRLGDIEAASISGNGRGIRGDQLEVLRLLHSPDWGRS